MAGDPRVRDGAVPDGVPREGQAGEEPGIHLFLGDPTRSHDHWSWLWAGDHAFPLHPGRRGLLSRLSSAVKRFLRRKIRSLLDDLWDRQRVFNLILIEWISGGAARYHDLRRHTDQMQRDYQGAIESHAAILADLDRRTTTAMVDVMRHNDALFARVDQKLDRYRQESRELWHRLGALLANAEAGPQTALAGAQREQSYFHLETRYRGPEAEIAERVKTYLPYLRGRRNLLDLGCGRGEALELFATHGIKTRGIDVSAGMVERCREKGLDAEQADLFSYLGGLQPKSFDAMVSFHVIEHIPPESLEQVVRLAWRALASGGVLILETPSPLSLVMAARNFWIDPTHRRPVHPATLEQVYREAGFEPVHQLNLHPFPAEERLPEIDLAVVRAEQRELADQINRLRDAIDDLLFGYRDFATIGIKP